MKIKDRLIYWGRINREQLKKVIISLFELCEKLFFGIPPLVAIYVSLRFLDESFFKSKVVSNETYAILITAIGLNATLSGLAFRASSSCVEDKKKKVFYSSGEDLFLACIMFIFAFFLKYSYNGITSATELSKTKQTFSVIFNILQFIFFVGGVFGAVTGLQKLLEVLLIQKAKHNKGKT